MVFLYDVWALLIIGIVLMITFLVLYPLYLDYKRMKGKARKISGEILQGIGIGLLVGAGLKYGILEVIYWAILLMSLFLIVIGTRMKYDDK